MTQRTFRRAGVELGDYKTICVQDSPGVLGELNNGTWQRAIVFGEDALYATLQRGEIQRWFNRQFKLDLKDRSVWIYPCLEPHLLLSRRAEEDQRGRKARAIRNPPRFTGAVIRCIKRAVDGKLHPTLATKYLEDPNPLRFGDWGKEFFLRADIDRTILSWDIETPYKLSEDDEEEFEEELRKREKTILRISFSYAGGEAVSVPWLPEYMATIRRLLAYTGFHCGWNILGFDVPIVEANGVAVGGFVLDGMDGWHMLQSDLDKGIEPVSAYYSDILPWKHLSDTLPAFYSCVDADAGWRNTVGIIEDLKEHNLWQRFIKEMSIMNLLNEAGRRGNNIDNDFRLELKGELESKMFDLLKRAQGLVDEKFLRRKFYTRKPKDAPGDWVEVALPKKVKVCDQCGKKASIKHKCTINQEQWQKKEITITAPHFYRTDLVERSQTLTELLDALSSSGFNPCSSDQMKTYMRAHKHPVGVNHKTKQDTADVKHIKKLLKPYGGKHPIYAHTLEIRLVQKALSTYVNGLEPDEHGRVHTSYVNSPSTWRLGSRNINVQNLGKRNDNPYAKKARKIIIPSKDRVLVNADSSAIEAVFVGKFMEDDNYIREARLGIHSGLCCQWAGIEPTEFNREKIKNDDPALYDRVKRVVHGTNYGMGAYMMHMNEPDKFPTIKSAQELQDFLFEKMPGLKKWHHQLRVFAQKNGYLDNPWGLRHYFYDVFTYNHDEDGKLIFDKDGLPKVKLGKDGKRVIAFKPQSSAGMFMRDNLHILGQTECREWMGATVSIHDGYCLDVPEAKVDVAVQILEEVLTRPIAEFGGLRVGCEIEVGEKNFLEMKKIKKVMVD